MSDVLIGISDLATRTSQAFKVVSLRRNAASSPNRGLAKVASKSMLPG